MTRSPNPVAISIALLLSRIVGGGALLLAGSLKLMAGPRPLAASIDAFRIIPTSFNLPMAYYLPWAEIVVGSALLLGLWTRQAALLAAGIYSVFTIALISVIARGMNVDCGCFGDLFGAASSVSWGMILRNLLFLSAAAIPALLGPGRIAIMPHDPPPRTTTAPTTEAA